MIVQLINNQDPPGFAPTEMYLTNPPRSMARAGIDRDDDIRADDDQGTLPGRHSPPPSKGLRTGTPMDYGRAVRAAPGHPARALSAAGSGRTGSAQICDEARQPPRPLLQHLR